MIIVDDRLLRTLLGGGAEDLSERDRVATTWGFQYRLVRALHDSRVEGRLSGADAAGVERLAADPPIDLIQVLDPRLVVLPAARLAIDHRLNLLTAELVAAAVVHDAEVVLSERNVGRRWPALFAELGITLTVV